MLLPIKIFAAPNNTELRLYKQNDFYYLPVIDIVTAIGYKSGSATKHGTFARILWTKYNSKVARVPLSSSIACKIIEVKTAKKILNDFKILSADNTYKDLAKQVQNIITKVIIPFTENYTPIEDDDEEEIFELEPMGAKEEIETVKTVKVPPSYNELEVKIAMLEAELKKAKVGTKKTVQLVFGERVSAEMKKRQWRLVDLAKFSGINSGTLAHATNGERALKLDDAAAVADALEVSLDYLCGRGCKKIAVQNR